MIYKLRKNSYYYLQRITGSKQIYHQDVIKRLKDIKKPILLEAGAADGRDTERFARLYPRVTIYAFEPIDKNYKILQNRVNGLTNVKIFKLALSDSTGTAEMNVSQIVGQPDEAATSSSLLYPELHISKFTNIAFHEKETVKTITLDDWAEQNNIDHIDAMWLDMQGMEYNVLKASKIINTVKVIYTEISLIELFKDSVLYTEYKSLLVSLGFRVVKEEIHKEFGYGNVLFIRK
ncbi:MAG: FkbM family methyltransferase [Bacteroidales bacterium]|nr:FkbM family methyltransferase [Bacteroidales bacterium]